MKQQMVFQRFELKYLLTETQLREVLAAMAPHMEPDEYPHSSIRSLYLDTPDFRLICRSLEKPVYKEKLRLRSYGRAAGQDPVFAELKKKYRSVVYKRRIALPQDRALACLAGRAPWPDTQIGGELAYAAAFYGYPAPRVFLSYERDSFASREGGDFRVTFDRAICFRQDRLTLDSEPGGVPLLGGGLVLMEVKSAEGMPLWMARTLSALEVRRTSFSKYGAAYRLMLSAGEEGRAVYA